jgi:hypothetical protein
MLTRLALRKPAHRTIDFGEQLADSHVARDRNDAQLLPEFILKRYCCVVLAGMN